MSLGLPNLVAFGEVVSADSANQYESIWRDLEHRAEPNPFGEIDFLRPALKHFGGAEVALVWADHDRSRLLALAAVTGPRLGFGFARVWRHEQAPSAGWLVDAHAPAPALAGLRQTLAVQFPFSAGFVAPRVELDGAVARVAVNAERFNLLRRAAHIVSARESRGGKRRKEAERLKRRLAESGELAFHVSGETQAFERFLALEAKGWKGARGTALAQAPERAAFAHEVAEGFARRGRLAVYELTLDKASIAAGVVLRSGRRAFFWKIAFDEALAAYSPGVMLTRALSDDIDARGEVDVIDSCAAQDHPMIDHLWPGRLEFADFAMPGGSPLFGPFLAWERAAPGLRERTKRIVLPLLGRKRS